MSDRHVTTRREFLAKAGTAMAGGAIGIGLAHRLPAQQQAQATAKPLFAFGIVADVQYADAPSGGSRHYRKSLEKLAACVREFNATELEFVVQLGDLIDRDLASYDAILPIYKRIETARHHVLGNHEFSVKDAQKDRVREILGVGRGYYQFSRPGWRFVVLNGNDISIQGSTADSRKRKAAEMMLRQLREKKRPNAMVYNGAAGPQQIEWLQKTLAEADRAGEKVVLFSHFPVLPQHALNLWNCDRVVEILRRHKSAAAHFNGHHHAGMYAQKDGIHFVTVEGMVETPDTTAFAVVEVYPDRLKIIGHGRVSGRVLEIS